MYPVSVQPFVYQEMSWLGSLLGDMMALMRPVRVMVLPSSVKETGPFIEEDCIE